MNPERQEVARFQVSNNQIMLVTLVEYKGGRYVDVRRHYYDAKKKLRPTKKGIFLSEDHISLVRKALRKALESINA
jgi:hypothetical protein